MTLQQLRYFRALARNKDWNLTRTAKALFISQPALSYAIASLERELGVELFHRRGQRLILTKTGEAFLCRVNDIFTRLTDAVAEVRSLREDSARRLTVGCAPDLTEQFLHDFLEDCCAGGEYDPAGLSLCYRREPELTGMLESGEADLVLCTAPRGAGVESRPLYTLELRLFVPRGHPLAGRPQVEPERLNGLELVRLPAGSPIQAAADEYLARNGIVCRTAAVQERVDDAVAFVANGLGVGLFPGTAAGRHGLQAISLAGRAPALTVCLGRKRADPMAGELERAWDRLLRYGGRWSGGRPSAALSARSSA